MRSVGILDAAVVAIATGITAGLLVYVNADDPDVIIQEVEVTVTPTSCARALDAADKVVAAGATMLQTANQVGPLAADAYATGLAGDAPTQLTKRVVRLNEDLGDAYVAAVNTPERYGLLAAQCRAQRTEP